MAGRIYCIWSGPARHDGDVPMIPRLVRATSPAQALRHVATDIMAVKVASQDDLVSLMGAGIIVENATAAAVVEEE